MRKFLPAVASSAVLSLGLLSTPASADLLFGLNVANISGFTAPYALVDVHLVSSTLATITFTSNTAGGDTYLLGDGGTVGVNVNATSWTISSISGTNAGTGFTPGPWSNGGSGNEDGFGNFNQKVTSFDGFTHSSDQISFDLTNTSGTWASDSAVLIANTGGNMAAAHIFVTSAPANASNGAINTGFATGDCVPGAIGCTFGPPRVPEPSALALVGGALVLFGLMRRRRAV